MLASRFIVDRYAFNINLIKCNMHVVVDVVDVTRADKASELPLYV